MLYSSLSFSAGFLLPSAFLLNPYRNIQSSGVRYCCNSVNVIYSLILFAHFS